MPSKYDAVMNNDYSEEELQLIEHYGYSELIQYVPAPPLYRMMIEKSFMLNENNKYSESLRRCASALFYSKPNIYRMTKEFDDLIQLD